MLRDFKFLRRKQSEEMENVPLNPRDSLASQASTDSSSSRPPLNAIHDPNPTSRPEPELTTTRSKTERTPTKPKLPSSFRTPDKHGMGVSAKHRFGWAQRGEESREEARLPNVTPRSTRTVVTRAHSGYSESNSTQSTPTKSVSKPPSTVFRSRIDGNGGGGGGRTGNFAALYRGIPVSGGSSSAVVNTVEVPHFDLKEDPSFWMEHNVQVLIRVRPLNSMEKSMNGYNRCLKQESAQCITWIGQPENRFTFDHVACESVDQEMLFRMAGLPMVENCLSGYNSCMFAYGQTGSGKTYTMLGEIDGLEAKPSPYRGMTPRIFEFLFARIQAEEESRRDERLKYNCKCSFLEIYNEQIADLLDPTSTNLLLREDVKKGVYVENLLEIEVQTVSDVLRLLTQGSLNRKVAATNMNRESSRSHSVFTCVIESRWEKDSTTNFRFARLNLVDLAGSERQKSSGAEGERLKEAANINKSLSTLGHVIMILVDVAQGKPKHVPYRDSRLTFLLQDSLGGNSKTMIIANVSPSICCAAETLNTLKFAQRAKLIQNNAVVNEDSTGDVIALQHQILLLKEELAFLKRQNVSRALSFESMPEVNQQQDDDLLGIESKGIIRMSTKQLKSLEMTLAGSLRREQMAESSIKKLEAEIEQLNRLVRQREEDTRSTKMMLRFREDRIQRLESLVGGLLPPDSYLVEENRALSEEIQLLQAKIDKNPEVTRFAMENIRLLEELRRFQDFYEDGEREILLEEVSKLRDQLVELLDGKTMLHKLPNIESQAEDATCICNENSSLHLELKHTLNELEDCRRNLTCCLEENQKLSKEILDLNAMLDKLKYTTHDQEGNLMTMKVSLEAPNSENGMPSGVHDAESIRATSGISAEEVLDLQLELDILKIILKEERLSHVELEQRTTYSNQDLEQAKQNLLLVSKQHDDATHELSETKSIVEALESQQILAINEIEELRKRNNHYVNLLSEKESVIMGLKEKLSRRELRDIGTNYLEDEDSTIQKKIRRMQDSLEKARRLNTWYKNDRAFYESNEEEMDEVRRQVEAETAEVIVSMQEELLILQQEVKDCHMKEIEAKQATMHLELQLEQLQEKLSHSTDECKQLYERLKMEDEDVRKLYEGQAEAETAEVIVSMQEELSILQQEVKDSHMKEIDAKQATTHLEIQLEQLQEKLCLSTEECKQLYERLKVKDEDVRKLSEEWDMLAYELEEVLADGQIALGDASDQLDYISNSFPQKRIWISEQVGRLMRIISEKELLIEELGKCLDDTNMKRNDVECMLKSLRGAALVINEAHQQECIEKEKEILLLTSQLKDKTSTISELEDKVKLTEYHAKKSSACATVAFVLVNRLSEVNLNHVNELNSKDTQLGELARINQRKEALLVDQAAALNDAEKEIQYLRVELATLNEMHSELQQRLSEEETRASAMVLRLEDAEESKISETREKLTQLKAGILTVRSHMGTHPVHDRIPKANETLEACVPVDEKSGRTDVRGNLKDQISKCSPKVGKGLCISSCVQKDKGFITFDDVCHRDATITLLKEEVESAFQSLQEVKLELAKLHKEKEEIWMSEKECQENMKYFMTQMLELQAAIINFEQEVERKMVDVSRKLMATEQIVQETGACWCQTKEFLEMEIGDSKILAIQKAAEASCIFAKFEEAQDTMKEADIMINELMIANEVMKIDMERLKETKRTVVSEKNVLINEVQSLQSIIAIKDQQFEDLEEKFCSSMMETRESVQELEGIIVQVQATFKENFTSLVSDFDCIKALVCHSGKVMHSLLEDVWSEIIVKDCAISVLHLCHMGILLETITGLNAENGLLQHGLCKSNSVIADLREHNSKSSRELAMCRNLKGKLLADIKNSFDRITGKEEETGKLDVKLSSFEKRISDLQHQEELMLQRSNYMGSQLTDLMKELDMSNSIVAESLSNQEKMLKDKEKLLDSQAEVLIMENCSRDIELFILMLQLKEMTLRKGVAEAEHTSCGSTLEGIKKELILSKIDVELKNQESMAKGAEVSLLQKELEELQKSSHDLFSKLSQSNIRITVMNEENMALKEEIQQLGDVYHANDTLKCELGEIVQTNAALLNQFQALEAEYEKLLKDMKTKETALENSYCHVADVDQEKLKLQKEIQQLETISSKLQSEVEMKETELCKMFGLEEENRSLKVDLWNLKAETSLIIQDLEKKNNKVESSLSQLHEENHGLQDRVSSLENNNFSLHSDIEMKNAELKELKNSQTVIMEDLSSKSQGLQDFFSKINSLENENALLRKQLGSVRKDMHKSLSRSSLNAVECMDSLQNVEITCKRFSVLEEKSIMVVDKMFHEISVSAKRTSEFMREIEFLECLAKELMSENTSLQAELTRKDDILKGLLFDLSLLQESASNSKDQKDKMEEIMANLDALEDELSVKSAELEDVVAHNQMLETQLQEKIGMITSLELEFAKARESLSMSSCENQELRSQIEKTLAEKLSLEEELTERRNLTQSLEIQLSQMDNAFGHMNDTTESLRSNMDELNVERDQLHMEIHCLKEKLAKTQVWAEENEAIAVEAQQVAETRKIYAEDKEMEVKLLEKSVEELEYTVNVLENKVDILKGEAERQRLQREELELELHAVNHQMQNVKSSDTDLERHFEEKEKDLEKALKHIQILEKEIAEKNAEITQCKAHISELNLHAEAQASEFKQKFKALEAMAEQVKPEGHLSQLANSSWNKSEKIAVKSRGSGSPFKSRGSGSPFKCIGLGLAQQMKSEKDEEFAAARNRIEELESLSASRQKEIFALNARLAAAESMTHDVIRDLLGVKLDMTNCMSLLDNGQVQKIAEKIQQSSLQPQAKEQEVIKLKQQLNEFIQERRGWLDEIDRKQAELVAAQIALETLRQQDQLLNTEIEMLKMDNTNHKRREMELEGEVKKLSGQQNLQQRIHHHAKIKEENNLLRLQNEELNGKLHRAEVIISRIKEELAHYRASSGRNPYFNHDEEQRLVNKLKESENERVQLAQKLLALCTSILKAAGITRSGSNVTPAAAEEALEQLKTRMASLERELQDLTFTHRISSERIRLSEIIPQTSPISSRQDDQNCRSPRRSVQAPVFSSLDR